MELALLIFLATILLIALIDFLPRLFNARKPGIEIIPGRGRAPDYLVMPTVYGDISYLKNIEFLKKYARHVVICTSKYESDQFYADLAAACKQHGLRYIAVDLPHAGGKPVKNAYTIYKGAFSDLSLLGVSPDTPCLLMDADTVSHDNVNDMIRTFVKTGGDVASLRCEAANTDSLLAVLQAYEYKTAMDNRHMDPWLTSGACSVGRAGVYQHVFDRHSDFFAGGDIEIGKLASTMGYAIHHLDFTFYTEVPTRLRDWFNQRIIWMAGGVRHHVVNIANFSWHHFFIFIYNSLLVYLLLPLRWVELVHSPLPFILLTVVSWAYIFIATIGRGWRKEYLLLPAYAFVQSMVILPIALGRYCKYAWQQRSLGILNQDMSFLSWKLAYANRFLNLAAAALIIIVAIEFTVTRADYWIDRDVARFVAANEAR